MSITKKVERILQKEEQKYKQKKTYQEYMKYYQEMLSRGIIKREEYDIPPIDTIGKRLYQIEDKE